MKDTMFEVFEVYQHLKVEMYVDCIQVHSWGNSLKVQQAMQDFRPKWCQEESGVEKSEVWYCFRVLRWQLVIEKLAVVRWLLGHLQCGDGETRHVLEAASQGCYFLEESQ